MAESLAAFAPAMPEAQRMNLLARFLFRGARIHLPVEDAGGERCAPRWRGAVRRTGAPIAVLDEPTNNLDLVSVGELETAFNAYGGAFVVVSRDKRFLDEMGWTAGCGCTKAGSRESGPLP